MKITIYALLFLTIMSCKKDKETNSTNTGNNMLKLVKTWEFVKNKRFTKDELINRSTCNTYFQFTIDGKFIGKEGCEIIEKYNQFELQDSKILLSNGLNEISELDYYFAGDTLAITMPNYPNEFFFFMPYTYDPNHHLQNNFLFKGAYDTLKMDNYILFIEIALQQGMIKIETWDPTISGLKKTYSVNNNEVTVNRIHENGRSCSPTSGTIEITEFGSSVKGKFNLSICDENGSPSVLNYNFNIPLKK